MALAGDVGTWSGSRGWRSRLLAPIAWTDLHRRLAAQPLFSRCSRAEVRGLARAGDECFVPAGTVLCREDRIGYWLYLVLSGTVALERRGGPCGTLTAGGHVGAVAILGFGPQPMTATASTDATVFALGRREVLDLVEQLPSVQEALFPDLVPGGYVRRLRSLREEGTAAWWVVPVEQRSVAADSSAALPSSIQRYSARRRGDETAVLRGLLTSAGGASVTATEALRPLSRRAVASLCACAVALAVVVGSTYHPGVLVVRPSAPVDVTRDVSIEGVPTRRPAGRYVLTAVEVSEPTAFGLLAAVVAGEPRLRAATGDDIDATRRGLREQFLESRRRAVAQAAQRHGHDPSMVRVRFRDRNVWGPSAGLLYALLLADMLGDVEVGRGKVIAATGVLGEGERVLPVSYVELKRRVAVEAGADLFLVPAGSATPGAVEVATVAEAIRQAGRTGAGVSPVPPD